jgi:hypothetical protein
VNINHEKMRGWGGGGRYTIMGFISTHGSLPTETTTKINNQLSHNKKSQWWFGWYSCHIGDGALKLIPRGGISRRRFCQIWSENVRLRNKYRQMELLGYVTPRRYIWEGADAPISYNGVLEGTIHLSIVTKIRVPKRMVPPHVGTCLIF